MRKKSAWRILAGFLAAVFALTAMPERALAAGEASAETAYEAEAAEESTYESFPEAPDLVPLKGEATVSKASGEVPSEIEAYNRMIALKDQYPEGMHWTNDDFYGWNGGIWSGGYGCAGFAFLLSDAAFGDLPARKHNDESRIKVGDILRVNKDGHSVVVLSIGDSYYTVAEGNYNSSIHWGRQIPKTNEITYIVTRYPEGWQPNSFSIRIGDVPEEVYAGDDVDVTFMYSLPEALTQATWTSSNPEVATVESAGKTTGTIHAKKVGATKITVSAQGYQDSFVLNVQDGHYGITIDPKPVVIKLGDTATFKATCKFASSETRESVEWDVSDDSVVRYTGWSSGSSGRETYITVRLRATAEGTTTITVSAGKYSKSFDIVVSRDQETRDGTPDPAAAEVATDTYDPSRDPDVIAEQEARAGVQAFVERLYTVILDRASDANGVKDWTDKLVNKEMTGADVARGFIMSAEFTNKNVNNDTYVRKLYKAFFDREPDDGGYKVWMDSLAAGKSRYNILTGFTNSNEFGNLCQRFGITRGSLEPDEASDTTPQPAPQPQSTEEDLLQIDSSGASREAVTSYVSRIYRKVLHRDPDEGGLNNWVDAIMNGRDAAGRAYDPATVIRTGFFTSREYTALNKSDEDFLKDVYLAFFDREPDEDGFNNWLGRLKDGTMTRDSVIGHGFGHSREFKNLLTGYGFVVK